MAVVFEVDGEHGDLAATRLDARRVQQRAGRTADVDIVVPTIGRPSLRTLLGTLDTQRFTGRVLVVDDRREAAGPLPVPGSLDVTVLAARGRGPAAARNVGWRASRATWIAFLDDDVVPDPSWAATLDLDLDLDDDVAASQGRIVVPRPVGRAPTDWERNVAGLEGAAWATADMAYRRSVLRQLGGFDERFGRAYREDADLALRALAAGHRLARGTRVVSHPVRPAPWYVSLTAQAGNADDAVMRRLHGRAWRGAAAAPAGAFRRHVLTTLSAVTALAAHRRRPYLAIGAALVWAASSACFAGRRIRSGPGGRREIATMVVTSAAIPPLAVWQRLRGEVRARALPAPDGGIDVAAVLFDRDGTLIHDVPYNGDAARVEPVEGARRALDRLRTAGLRLGIVSNQSGIARGLLTRADADRVNARVAELLGPFDVVIVCEHAAEHGCGCRKPQPGMVLEAAAELGVPVERCVVVGDIGSDVDAARLAGATPILVPNAATRREEITAAPAVAGDVETAVDLILGGR
jgi:HAD superfamily hydrolase (TIGR01662 family)